MDKNTHSGHRERMRKRYLNAGNLDSFDEHQILEMLLFYAIPRKDTNEIAHKMIKEFGSLEILINASPEAIANRTGVSLNTAVLVSMVGALKNRVSEGSMRGVKLKDASQVKKYCIELLKNQTTEVFYVICLDAQRQVIAPIEIAKGGEKQVEIRLSAMLAQIGTLGPKYAVCTHNHPNKIMQFSVDDIKSTLDIKRGLEQYKIKLMDHILVCGNEAVSMSEIKNYMFK